MCWNVGRELERWRKGGEMGEGGKRGRWWLLGGLVGPRGVDEVPRGRGLQCCDGCGRLVQTLLPNTCIGGCRLGVLAPDSAHRRAR